MTHLETDGALAGPDGWLPWSAGTLLYIRVEGGRLAVSADAEPGAESGAAAARIATTARQWLEALARQDDGVPIKDLLIELLAEDADLLARPLPPLGEILADARLEVHRGHVGLPGTDWSWVDSCVDYDEAAARRTWDDDPDDIESDEDWAFPAAAGAFLC